MNDRPSSSDGPSRSQEARLEFEQAAGVQAAQATAAQDLVDLTDAVAAHHLVLGRGSTSPGAGSCGHAVEIQCAAGAFGDRAEGDLALPADLRQQGGIAAAPAMNTSKSPWLNQAAPLGQDG